MSASKTSAVADEPIDVLVALHPKFDLLDFAGPVQVFTSALHDAKDESKYLLFICSLLLALLCITPSYSEMVHNSN